MILLVPMGVSYTPPMQAKLQAIMVRVSKGSVTSHFGGWSTLIRDQDQINEYVKQNC